MAVDATGVYVAGETGGALPGQTRTSGGGDDAFVRKYDRNGNELWTRQFGSAGQFEGRVGEDRASGVAADATGVYMGGVYKRHPAGANPCRRLGRFCSKAGREQRRQPDRE